MTIALSLGTFIQILDTSIANVSLSHISGGLAATPTQGTWVITSFTISNGIVLALTGWLTARVGPIRLFVLSTSLFSLTSWLCGFAPTLSLLVFFRILQGASAGVLIPLSQALLVSYYPHEKRGLALGFWSMIVVVAPIMGPVIGGYITDNYGWPWIFYINVPLGLFSAWLTWLVIGKKETPAKRPIDIVGLILLSLGISALQVGLDKGQELDWFNSNFIIASFILSFLGFVFFIPWNVFSRHPVMEFSYFKDVNFVTATILASLFFLLFFGSTVTLPLWLINEQGYTAFWAGIALMPIGIIPLFMATYVGKYVQKIDARYFATVSFFTSALTFFWFSNLTPDASLFKIMLPRFYQGFSLATFFIPLLTLALANIPREETAAASGSFNFVRLVVGGGIGTAVFTTMWQRREIFHHSRLVENLNLLNPYTTEFFESLRIKLGITQEVSERVLDQLVEQQASLLAINDLFWLAGWLLLVLMPFIWLCHKPKDHVAASDAGH